MMKSIRMTMAPFALLFGLAAAVPACARSERPVRRTADSRRSRRSTPRINDNGTIWNADGSPT